MIEFEVTHKARSVNTKRVLQQFVQLIEEVSHELIIPHMYSSIYAPIYDYSQLPELLEVYCEELVEEGVITTFDVLCDHRNNREVDVGKGHINLTIGFKQFNCLNTTTIDFFIRRK